MKRRAIQQLQKEVAKIQKYLKHKHSTKFDAMSQEDIMNFMLVDAEYKELFNKMAQLEDVYKERGEQFSPIQA